MKVLVTDPIDDAGLERLREAGLTVETEYEITEEDLLAAVEDANGLIVRSGTAVTETVFEAAADLQIVGRAGIGVDNIDLDAATDHGVIVANAPEGNVRAAAEHTVAMAFATARQIPQAHDRLNAGEWAKSDFLGTELNGKTLGIVGLGRVGQEVGTRLGSLGMDIVAFDPYIGEERAQQLGAELVDLETCLDRADVLTIHVPLTDETEGLIGEAELATLGDGHLINVSRGGVVEEAALAEAVAEGQLRGAALDVFTEEPVPADNPVLQVSDIVTTPHLGASTREAQENVAVSAAEQVIAALEDRPVANALNAPSVDETAFPRIAPYIDLAETAGKVAGTLFAGRLSEIEVRYAGDIAGEDVERVTASAQKGVFAPLEWQVNVVNAQRVAEKRGISVVETKSRQSADFRSLVSVVVGDGEETLEVSGTLFGDEEPRLVAIDGFRVDAIPHGQMLVARNRDVPGVIGYIGTVLGECDINIAGMFNGRETVGGEALTVYNLDDVVPSSCMERILEDERIIEATAIELDGTD